MTLRQRESDDALREEAIRRNSNLSEQDRAKNLQWVVVGRKGTRKLIKKAGKEHDHPTADRNGRKRARETATAAADHLTPERRRTRVEEATGNENEQAAELEEERETGPDPTGESH